MKNARYTAVEALLRMSGDGAYSNLALDSLVRQNALDPRDAAFAGALFYGTLERRLTLDHILRAHSAKLPEQLTPVVREILRTGLYQLCFMNGVDDYAAVNESVNLAKAMGAAQAAGYVNGVLRAFLRVEKAIPPVQGDRAAQLAVEYSCPAWLIDRWLKAYGETAAMRILAASLGAPPLYLRVNPLRIDAAALAKQLEAEHVIAKRDIELPECLQVTGGGTPEKWKAFAQGLFHVQDRASQFCAAALDAQPGERVLDVCAAPGGKSFTIAQRMENRGELVAQDLHPKRVGMIEREATRLGLSIIKASQGDASRFDINLGFFDRALCDVPCSGFGSIRRKPEIKYKPQESIQKLPDIQYKILRTTADYLKEGGSLVYSTCTLLSEENEQVIERFLREDGRFSRVSQKTFTGEDSDSDGFFVCLLRRETGGEAGHG